jgi:hypothetical protein
MPRLVLVLVLVLVLGTMAEYRAQMLKMYGAPKK